ESGWHRFRINYQERTLVGVLTDAGDAVTEPASSSSASIYIRSRQLAIDAMKIKLIAAIALLAGMVGLAGCYDVGPGYGYGGGGYPSYTYAQPSYGYGGGYSPGYYGGYGNGYRWGHDWNYDHWRYPEHTGFVAHYGAPNRGWAFAHNEGV